MVIWPAVSIVPAGRKLRYHVSQRIGAKTISASFRKLWEKGDCEKVIPWARPGFALLYGLHTEVGGVSRAMSKRGCNNTLGTYSFVLGKVNNKAFAFEMLLATS